MEKLHFGSLEQSFTGLNFILGNTIFDDIQDP